MEINAIHRSNKLGAYWAVEAPCFGCGRPAEGRVANSWRDAEASEKIARGWVDDLVAGRSKLWCEDCIKKGMR